jgi:glycosyltransferase involved in cell wall biosynthesis
MITISYAITCCNEYKEFKRLIKQLLPCIKENDEIVIQQDECTDSDALSIKKYIEQLIDSDSRVRYIIYKLNKNFADFKNNLKSNCKKDYIYFIDADETLSENMLYYLHQVLDSNPVDLFMVPRANTVKGLTQEHIKVWNWRVDPDGLINWPDYQSRIVRNKVNIKWEGKVHERIVGYSHIAEFPTDSLDWCLHHNKDIAKQEQQNNFYSKI